MPPRATNKLNKVITFTWMLTIQKFFNARYATEVDVDFVRKSVRAIGRCAIKVEVSSTCSQFFKTELLTCVWTESCTCVLKNSSAYRSTSFSDARLLPNLWNFKVQLTWYFLIIISLRSVQVLFSFVCRELQMILKGVAKKKVKWKTISLLTIKC